MATVNKDFRIKAGLVVEGANATVNGEDIITTGSSTDDLQEGSTNLYFTNQRAIDAVGGDINSAVSTAINALTTDDIEEGTSNLYFTDSRAVSAVETAATSANTADKIVQRDSSGNFSAGNVSATQVTVQDAGQIFEDSSLVVQSNSGYPILILGNQNVEISSNSGDILLDADGDVYKGGSATAGNQIVTQNNVDQYIGDATVNGSTGNTITDRIASAQSAAQTYADGLAVNYDAAGAADTAQSNAEDYTDNALESYTLTEDLDATVGGYGYIKSADLSGYATESYVGTAVSNAVDGLVDGAPGLLDTLNEIAAAIADDENYATTMTTALAGKQNELTAGTNISIVSDTISVTGLASTDISDFNTAALSATASAYDAAGAAATAEGNANDYTDTAISGLSSVYEAAGSVQTAIDALDTDDIEEGGNNLYFTDERAIDAVSAADIYPNAVIVNNVSKTVANTQSVSTASTVSGIAWAKADYKSAKLVVKAATATHSQVSEIMVTLDSSDNVAITEFGIVYTDDELATVTADVSGTDVRVRVTTLNASTTVTVVGTLLV